MNTGFSSPTFEYLDAEMREQIVDLMDGDAEMIIDLIDTLTESTPELMDALAAELQHEQAEGIREAAHALKSSHAQLGATGFAAICQQLENMAKAGDLSEIDAVYERLLREHRQVEAALDSWKRKLLAGA